MITIKATIYLEDLFWVGCFERTDRDGFAVARKIFPAEPSDAEIYEFVLHHFHELNFGAPQKFNLQIKRMNPKRLQRQIHREMEEIKKTHRPSTMAQETMREQLELNKKEKKKVSKEQKEAEKEKQFLLKQAKRKQKQKGH